MTKLSKEEIIEVITIIHKGLYNSTPDLYDLHYYEKLIDQNGYNLDVLIKFLLTRANFLHKLHDTDHHLLFEDFLLDISKDEKFIFLHIPRTGGHTLHYIMTHYFGQANVTPIINSIRNIPVSFLLEKKIVFIHSDFDTIELIYGNFKNRKLITFIRDPLERIISVFKFWRAHNFELLKDNIAVRLAHEHEFSEFFKVPYVRMCLENNMFARFIGYKTFKEIKKTYSHLNKQKKEQYIKEEIIPLIKERYSSYFFVGILEDLKNEIKSLLNKMQLNPDYLPEIPKIYSMHPHFDHEFYSLSILKNRNNIPSHLKHLIELDIILYDTVKEIKKET